jgi:CBS domain-containing protein
MVVHVKDVMSTPVYTIDINKTAQDAGKLMRKIRRGFLVVTKRKKPVGVISDSDIINKIVAKNKLASKIKVGEIMSKPIISVSSNEDMLKAVRKMKKSNIHRLPVIDQGKLVGVISLTDIARTSPEMLDLLEYRLKMKERPFMIRERYTVGICDMCGNYSERLENINDQWVCENCKDQLAEE